LSRNTIKKYLSEDAIEPRFKTPSRPSKLDPYADRLSAWLLAQTRKSRKERRTVKLMYEDLVKLGYDGSWQSSYLPGGVDLMKRAVGFPKETRPRIMGFGVTTQDVEMRNS
jgi:hypothetical protein